MFFFQAQLKNSDLRLAELKRRTWTMEKHRPYKSSSSENLLWQRKDGRQQKSKPAVLIKELVCFGGSEAEQKQGFFHNSTSMTSLGRLFHCLMGPQCLTISPNDCTCLVSPLYIVWSSFEHILCVVFFWKCLW